MRGDAAVALDQDGAGRRERNRGICRFHRTPTRSLPSASRSVKLPTRKRRSVAASVEARISVTTRRVVGAAPFCKRDFGTCADDDAAARDADAEGTAAAEDLAAHGLELSDVIAGAFPRDPQQRRRSGRVERQAGAAGDACEVLDTLERVVGADVADAAGGRPRQRRADPDVGRLHDVDVRARGAGGRADMPEQIDDELAHARRMPIGASRRGPARPAVKTIKVCGEACVAGSAAALRAIRGTGACGTPGRIRSQRASPVPSRGPRRAGSARYPT